MKILFNIVNKKQVEDVLPHAKRLENEDTECAFCTTDIELVKRLAIEKRLVVKEGTYFPDILVSNVPLEGYDVRLSFKEFMETV